MAPEVRKPCYSLSTCQKVGVLFNIFASLSHCPALTLEQETL